MFEGRTSILLTAAGRYQTIVTGFQSSFLTADSVEDAKAVFPFATEPKVVDLTRYCPEPVDQIDYQACGTS
jgi:hypothetical protein